MKFFKVTSLENTIEIVKDNLEDKIISSCIVPLRDSLGLMLAEDIVSPEVSPLYNRSTVDGECGQAFICYPDKNTMHDFYANSGEVPHKTISFNVGLAASLETMLAYRVLTNDDEEYKGKIIIFDLPSGLIKVMNL